MKGKEKLFDGLKPMTPGFFITDGPKLRMVPTNTEVFLFGL